MSSSDEGWLWISEFCKKRGNEYFCKVDEDYIEDRFNLMGLNKQVPHYNTALNIITGEEFPEEFPDDDFDQAAEMLYGLIHARFIMTSEGLALMLKKYQEGVKYEKGDFGPCPRVYCENQRVLPIGLSDVPGESPVKLFCPRCQDVYQPYSSRFHKKDGAYFGTGFPHLFFMVYPELRPKPRPDQFDPRLYGFKIHPTAYDIQLQAAAARSRSSSSRHNGQKNQKKRKRPEKEHSIE